ncbi:hypothetical protein, unlikely [Trypanosoma congolense IL3000]|uniref:Uncharacterized protein n=1 Tax=Trypanosoma congolense (strain IL3000) TaxID=1068625 RepID=F9W6D3_TRYCI|nr:hypothetical protein, unlikely [Trypanosoma congolense IL3000]CCD12738.1 hypothetical protein, unlikely [Trypanosoma congolense IL3000]
MHGTIEVPIKPHEATVLQLAERACLNTAVPGGHKTETPEKEERVHTMGRVQRFNGYGYQLWTDGSVTLDVSSGAEALVCPLNGKREKVTLCGGNLDSSFRVECVAVEAGLHRLLRIIEMNESRKTRVVAFTGSLSLLVALKQELRL